MKRPIIQRGWGWWAHLFLTAYRSLDPQEGPLDDALVNACMKHLPIEEGARVLDCGCGSGEHALRLARAGCRVVGVDISRELIAYCRSRIPPDLTTLEFRQSDMREPMGRDEFSVAIVVGVSFGYFDHGGNVATVKRLAQALEPGGRLLIENDNILNLGEGWVEETQTLRGLGLLVMRRRFNVQNRCLEGNFHLDTDRGERVVLERRAEAPFDETIRVYSRQEMETMVSHAGLELREVWGAIEDPPPPYEPTSGRCVVVAQKPAP